MTRSILGLTLLALAAAPAVRAQPAPGTPAAEALAEQLFAQGKRDYDIGEYAAATTAFKEAYRLTGEPLLLFNIAQAQRKQNDCAGARNTYRSYLRNLPDAPNRAKVEGFIAEAEACVGAQGVKPPDGTPPPDRTPPPPDGTPDGAPPDGAPPDGTPDGTPPDGTPPPDLGVRASSASHPGRTLRWAGLGVAGVGVAALGAGVYFGLQARAAADDIAACTAPCAPEVWEPLDADGRAANRNAIIAYTVGGLGVAAGATMYFLGMRAAAAEAPVVIAPTAGGATVHAVFAF